MALPLANMVSLLQNMRAPEPRIVDLGVPPLLTGVLDPNHNSWLSKAKRYANQLVPGAESMAIVGDRVYTGLSDGWVVEIRPFRPNGRRRKILRMSTRACEYLATEFTCGRPLGIRVDSQGFLIVADPYKGIYKINPDTGLFEKLVDSKLVVNQRPLGFINDLSVASDGTIFFSSSSTKWSHAFSLNILLEAEKSGRVFTYNPHEADSTQRVKELVTTLSFPDGLQLSINETYLLIAEKASAKIYKAHLGDSPKQGTIEVLADNLPGFVNNIRLSPRGTYWVGLSWVRHQGFPSILDRFGNQKSKRLQYMFRPPSEVLQTEFPKHGMALELDDEGRIVRSLQDPSGTVFSSVSEVQEHGNFLFVASPDRDYLGMLRLSDIPQAPPDHQPTDPPGQHVTDAPNGTTSESHRPTSPPPIPNTNTGPAAVWLGAVARRLKGMSSSDVRGILVKLVFLLMEAAMETRRAVARLVKVENELLQLRSQFHRGVTQHQKQLIRSSWQAYTTGPGVMEDTVVVFLRLFNDTPDSVALFSHLGVQVSVGTPPAVMQEALVSNARFMGLVSKVVDSLQTVVTSLDQPQVVANLLRNSGKRHARYGVRPKHFPPFKAGVFEAMEKRLGSSFTLEARQAWEALLDILFDQMQQGLHSVRRL